MDIPITIIGATREYEHVEAEKEAADIILDDLGLDKSLFKYVKPCVDYSTIQYRDDDLFRIKYTDRAKWIQIPVPNDMREKYKDDPLFEAQKKKNVLMWKSNITDLHDYKDLLLGTIEEINSLKKD